MSRTTITGWVELKTLDGGKTVAEVSGNQAPRQKNRDTDQWEQVGDPLYVKAAFWDEDAEYVARVAGDDRVTVEGELVARNYQTKDGREGVSLELRYPRFLGVIPRREGASRPAQPPVGLKAQPDPMGGGPSLADEPPF